MFVRDVEGPPRPVPVAPTSSSIWLGHVEHRIEVVAPIRRPVRTAGHGGCGGHAPSFGLVRLCAREETVAGEFANVSKAPRVERCLSKRASSHSSANDSSCEARDDEHGLAGGRSSDTGGPKLPRQAAIIDWNRRRHPDVGDVAHQRKAAGAVGDRASCVGAHQGPPFSACPDITLP